MSSGAYTIPDGAGVEEALAELTRRNVKRLMVVGDRGQLVGIITAIDLLRACPELPRRSGPALAEAHPCRFHGQSATGEARLQDGERLSA